MSKYSQNIVENVTPAVMDGDNALERELNSIITREFIGTSNLPADECLSEAVAIIEIIDRLGIISNKPSNEIYVYLLKRFYVNPTTSYNAFDDLTREILEAYIRHSCL